MRVRRWLGASVAVVASLAGTVAFGATGTDTITTFAGTGLPGFSGDGGPATSAQLTAPRGVAVDRAGNVYIADSINHRVRKVSPNGTITTVVGTGTPGLSGDGGPATSTQIFSPSDVAVDGQGNLYISDLRRVRKVSPDGTIAAFAGTDATGFSGDGGPATSAQMGAPAGLAVDGQGNVFITDKLNQRVRKVSTDGTIRTVVGSGGAGYSGDGGLAITARLTFPDDIAVDGQGNLYIAEALINRVRKVDPGGTITTVAGTGAQGGFSGDGGPATAAQLWEPAGLAVDGQGNLYVSDQKNQRVRKVGRDGLIETIVGTGTFGFLGDGGPAGLAQLNGPQGLAVDARGDLYVSDSFNHRVRKVGRAEVAPAANLQTTIPSPQTVRNGPATAVAPGRISLRSLKSSKCVLVRLRSLAPARVLVTIYSGRRSIRLFGQKRVVFRAAERRDVCITVPRRAHTFDVRTPLRVALGVASGATPRKGEKKPKPVIRPIRLTP
jgi:sugar lactone lactonase YvrE